MKREIIQRAKYIAAARRSDALLDIANYGIVLEDKSYILVSLLQLTMRVLLHSNWLIKIALTKLALQMDSKIRTCFQTCAYKMCRIRGTGCNNLLILSVNLCLIVHQG